MKNFIYIFIAILTYLSLGVSHAYAGPFGTTMGESIESFKELQYKNTSKEGFKIYRDNNIKLKHPDFIKYNLFFKDDKLCGVSAFSKLYSGETGEVEANKTLTKIVSQLNQKYPQMLREKVVASGMDGFGWNSKNDTFSLPDDLLHVGCVLVSRKNKKTEEYNYFILITYMYKNSSEVYNKNEIDSL